MYESDLIKEIIYNKFSSYTNKTHIGHWLDNFKPSDIKNIIPLIERYRIFSEIEIYTAFDNLFQKHIYELGKGKIYILPCGDIGKSGMSMTYLLKKVIKNYNLYLEYEFISSHKILKTKIRNNQINQNDMVMVVDDIIGSGKTVAGYLKTYILNQIHSILPVSNIYVSVIASYLTGEQVINRLNPQINIVSAFPKIRKAFSRPTKKWLRIREFSYKYGEQIQPENPLGYNNTQGLISFSYGTPNNTLPIFWHGKNSWVPLFPRFTDDMIFYKTQERKEILKDLAILKVMKSDCIHLFQSQNNGFNSIKKVDFSMYFVLKLMMLKYPIYKQLEILGIFRSEYDLILQDAIKTGLLNYSNSLTPYGNELYLKIQNEIYKYKKTNKINNIHTRKTNYLPSSIRGIK